MSFFKNIGLYKLFYSIIILSLLTFSCSTDNSITGSSEPSGLNKPISINSIYGNEPTSTQEKIILLPMSNFINYLKPWQVQYLASGCALLSIAIPELQLSKTYKFRDNFLSKSEKGIHYIHIYYQISKYAIENNLILTHYDNNLSLLKNLIEKADVLQYGQNPNRIIINKNDYTNYTEIINLYREHDKTGELSIFLNYIEYDLEKYYNKTKEEVAMDFGF